MVLFLILRNYFEIFHLSMINLSYNIFNKNYFRGFVKQRKFVSLLETPLPLKKLGRRQNLGVQRQRRTSSSPFHSLVNDNYQTHILWKLPSPSLPIPCRRDFRLRVTGDQITQNAQHLENDRFDRWRVSVNQLGVSKITWK